MPKTIKQEMSRDMLEPFDSVIERIVYSDKVLEVYGKIDEDYFNIWFDEKDLETMLAFLRRNK